MKSKKPGTQSKVTPIKLSFNKDKINSYNENYEHTMSNIYAMSLMMHQVYARLGYQIKVQEQILDELKKRNK